LLGRRFVGGTVPIYEGYRLRRRILGAPIHAFRAFTGSVARGAPGEEFPPNQESK
jgi:hypothetical protein